MVYQNSTVPFEKNANKICGRRRSHAGNVQMALRTTHGSRGRRQAGSPKIRASPNSPGISVWLPGGRFDTRMGAMYLMVPKIRNGRDIPSFVEARKRSEAALMNVIQEAYGNGMSTRKIDKLTKQKGSQPLAPLLLCGPKRSLLSRQKISSVIYC